MSSRAGTSPDDTRPGSAPRRRSIGKMREALQLAILRVKTRGLKLSISSVARRLA